MDSVKKIHSQDDYNITKALNEIDALSKDLIGQCLNEKVIKKLATFIENNKKVKVRLKPIFEKLKFILKENLANKSVRKNINCVIKEIIIKGNKITTKIYELNNTLDSIIYYQKAYENVDPMTGTLMQEKVLFNNFEAQGYQILIDGEKSIENINVKNAEINHSSSKMTHEQITNDIKSKKDFIEVLRSDFNFDLFKTFILSSCISAYIKDIDYSVIVKKIIRKKSYNFIKYPRELPYAVGSIVMERESLGKNVKEIRESLLFMLEFPMLFAETEKLKNVFKEGFTWKNYQGGGNYGIILKTENNNDIQVVKKISRTNESQETDYIKHKIFLDFLIKNKELGNVPKYIHIPDIYESEDWLEFKRVRGKTLLRIEVENILLLKNLIKVEDKVKFTLIPDQHLFHYFYEKHPDEILSILELNEDIGIFFAKGFQDLKKQETRMKKLLPEKFRKDFKNFIILCKKNGLNNIDFANPANLILGNNGKMILFDFDNADILKKSEYYGNLYGNKKDIHNYFDKPTLNPYT